MPVAYSTILLTVSALTAFFSVPYLRTTRKESQRNGIKTNSTQARMMPPGSQIQPTKIIIMVQKVMCLTMSPTVWVRIFS